jgi:hypothetical protein
MNFSDRSGHPLDSKSPERAPNMIHSLLPSTSYSGNIDGIPFILTWDHSKLTMTFRINPKCPHRVRKILYLEGREFNNSKPTNVPDYKVQIIEDSDFQ